MSSFNLQYTHIYFILDSLTVIENIAPEDKETRESNKKYKVRFIF